MPTATPHSRPQGLRAWIAPLAIVVLACLSFGIGLADLPLQDRDEARYMQSSRQMAETGDWVDIRFQDQPRHVKPVGAYWMQAAVLSLTGTAGTTEVWIQRLPSYLAGILACLALFWAGTPLAGRRAAIVSGVMLASVYMLHAEARTAKTDAALLLSVILAMGAMARVWLGGTWLAGVRRFTVPAVFWTAMAAGLLIKGPIILMPVLGAAAWVSIKARCLRWIGALQPLPGVAWMLALALPWFVAIMIRTDGGFLLDSLGGDLAEKVRGEGEHSGFPPGVYLLMLWYSFWPWAIFAPLALVAAWRSRTTPETAFLLGWLVPAWIVFEAISTKLIHYTLPLYPALILLAATPVLAIADGTARFRGWAAYLGTAGFAVGTAIFMVMSIAGPITYGDGLHPLSTAGGAALGAAALLGVIWLYRGQAMRAVAALTAAGVLMGWTLTAVSLPAMQAFWVTPRIGAAMAELTCFERPIALAGYTQPSTVFELGTDTIHTDPQGAFDWLAEGDNRAAWIDPRQLPEGVAAPEGVADLTEIRGINYTNGDDVHIRLFISPGVAAPDAPCPPAN